MAIKQWWSDVTAPLVRYWEKIVPWGWLREAIETVVWAVALAFLLKAFKSGIMFCRGPEQISTTWLLS